jgi:hypothetical protein
MAIGCFGCDMLSSLDEAGLLSSQTKRPLDLSGLVFLNFASILT